MYVTAAAVSNRRATAAPAAALDRPRTEEFPSINGESRARQAAAVPAAYAARSNAAGPAPAASPVKQARGAQLSATQFPSLAGAQGSAPASAAALPPDAATSANTAPAPGTVSDALKAANKVRHAH